MKNNRMYLLALGLVVLVMLGSGCISPREVVDRKETIEVFCENEGYTSSLYHMLETRFGECRLIDDNGVIQERDVCLFDEYKDATGRFVFILGWCSEAE